MSPEAAAVPHVDPAELATMLAPDRTALIVIDVQADFAGPEGAMARIGLDFSRIEPAIDRIQALIGAARTAGAKVAFARVVTSEAADPPALKLLNARKGRPPEAIAICREDQPGSAYYRVAPQPGDIEVSKRLFDCFHGTRFDEELRAQGVDTLVVVGFTTDCCVDATARSAFHRDYNVFVLSDATDAYDPALHAGALRALQKNCALVADSEAVLAAWAGAAA